MPKLQHQQKHQQQLHKKKRHQPQQQQQHKKTTHQPHHKKKRHQRPRHKKEKEQPRKKKRHQKEQLQKATQAHKKKGMQPQLPLGQKTRDPNGRRSGRPKWWSKLLRISRARAPGIARAIRLLARAVNMLLALHCFRP